MPSLYDSRILELFQNVVIVYDVENLPQIQLDEDKRAHLDLPEEGSIARFTHDKFCITCGVTCEDRQEQIDHFRCDWHIYNLKRKLISKAPISENEFESIVDGMSSLSASDSDNSDGYEKANNGKPSLRRPKLYFKNDSGHMFSIYRALLCDNKNTDENNTQLVHRLMDLPNSVKWAIFLFSSGHFAAGVFDKDLLVLHKTFHRYVTRAKRGTLQSSHDNRRTIARSAGAHIRRYNEAALTQEIQELLNIWRPSLIQCNLIFIRAPNYSRFKQFFQAKDRTFPGSNTHFRRIPFATKRPTLNELKRVHKSLSMVQICDANAAGNESGSSSKLETGPGKGSPQRINSKQKSKDEPQPFVIEGEIPDTQCGELILHNTKLNDNDSESIDDEYNFVDEVVSFEDLKEFDSSVENRSKKRKKKTAKPTLSNSGGVDNDNLRSKLLTMCQKGDYNSLCRILQPLLPRSFCEVSSDVPSTLPCLMESSSTDSVTNFIETKEIPQKLSPTTMSINGSLCSYSPSVIEDELLSCTAVGISNLSIANEKDYIKISENLSTVEDCNALNFSDICNVPSIDMQQCNVEAASTNELIGEDSNELVTSNSGQLIRQQTNEPVAPNVLVNYNLNFTKDDPKLKHRVCDIDTSLALKEENGEPMTTKLLLKYLNLSYGKSKTTVLHEAVRYDHKPLIEPLLLAGADPSLRDVSGLVPFNCSTNKEIRDEFRKIRAKYPNLCNYDAGKIPPGATEKDLITRKEHIQQKQKEHQRNKKLKSKLKRAEERNAKAEVAEKERFLALSDREKRALAAERRLLAQRVAAGQPQTVLLRCFMCAEDITSKVPFEYYDYKFCTTQCLRKHRLNEKGKTEKHS